MNLRKDGKLRPQQMKTQGKHSRFLGLPEAFHLFTFREFSVVSE